MEYITFAVFAVTIVIAYKVFVWWLRRNDDYWEKRGIPFIKRPGISDILKALKKPFHESVQEAYNMHGRVHGAFEFRKPVLVVSEPDLLRDILVKDFHIFNYRRDFQMGDKIIDSMVSLLKGDEWKRVRTVISPAFTSKRMREVTDIINECSQTVLETFRKYSERQEPVDVKSIFGAFIMDVIASAAFATKIDSHNDPENIFVKKVKMFAIDLNWWRMLIFMIVPTWVIVRYRLFSFGAIDFFRDVIVEVIAERKRSGKKYNDILQLLMDAEEEVQVNASKSKTISQEDESDQFGSVLSKESVPQKVYKSLSENEIVAQCVLFFVVGQETTGSALIYMAYELALNLEVQEKLIKEVDEAFEKHKKFDYDVVRDMKYLDCVLSETLRRYPALVRSERSACEDYKLGNTGITIEKGTLVGYNIYSLHYDPEFFPDPETFRPERFLKENATHPQYAYLPFGAGPRNCLGMRFAIMEIKLLMCNILKNYKFKKAGTTKVPLDFKPAVPSITVRSLPLMVEPR